MDVHEHKEIKKKTQWNYVAIAMAVLLVLAVGYIVVDKFNSYQNTKVVDAQKVAYQQGLKDANQYIVNQIITDLNSKGETAITIPTGANNKTVTVPLIALTTIVGQLNQNGKFSFETLDQNNKSISVDLILPNMCEQYKLKAQQSTN